MIAGKHLRPLLRMLQPLFFGIHTGLVVLHSAKEGLLVQNCPVGSICSRLPRNSQLRYRTARKALRHVNHPIDLLISNVHGCHLLRPSTGGVQKVFLNILGNHPLALVRPGNVKLNHFIDAIHNSFVKLRGLVTGIDHHELIALRTSPIEEGIQRIALVLGNFGSLATLKEGVGLVNEQEQPAPRGFGPLKKLVKLRDGVSTQWRNVTTREDGIVQSRLLRQSSSEHGFACTGRAVQKYVAERGLVLLGVSRRNGNLTQLRVQSLLQDNSLERILFVNAHTENTLRRLKGMLQKMRHSHARSFSDQAGLSKSSLNETSADANTGPGSIHSCRNAGHR
mmetsp:Transcript_15390/g.36716  ORF Transcript_15390/g.36716 Transcript_15390/m.36716 type:complete len:337 (+) Transcript_15390:1461-2471(+)